MINLLIVLLVLVCVVLLQVFLSSTVLCVQSDCPAQYDCGKQCGSACLAYRKHPDSSSASGVLCLPREVPEEEPVRKDENSGFGVKR